MLVAPAPGLVSGTPFAAPDAVYHRQLVEQCGKLHLLDRMLRRLKERGHRVIIFSQFVIVLNLLEQWLRHRAWNYARVDGSVDLRSRQARIDAYNAPGSPLFVFLLSTRAGGQAGGSFRTSTRTQLGA